MAELDQVRSSGFAVDQGEFDIAYCSVAAPVLASRDRFLAVLGLTTFNRRFETEVHDLVDAVREVAAGVSGRTVQPGNRDDMRAPQAATRRAA
jgi:DNA-binding IclR family transcriptional regulator